MTEVLLQRLTVNCETLDGNAAICFFKKRSARQNHFANSWDEATQRYDTRADAASHVSLELSPGKFIWFIERRERLRFIDDGIECLTVSLNNTYSSSRQAGCGHDNSGSVTPTV